MKKSKCLSMSLYGEKIWYYLPLLFNIDQINRSGFDYDIVLRAEEKSKKMLERIMQQEDIHFNNSLIVETMPRDSFLSRGMFWRYHEILLDRYDYVMVVDVDSIQSGPNWDVMDQFIQSERTIGTFKHLSCNGSLVDGGFLFFNRRKLDNDFLRAFGRICELIDKEDIVNYSFDQDIMEEILKPYMKSGEFVLYEAYNNKSWLKYNDEGQIKQRMHDARQNYVNIVDLSDYEFRRLGYKNGWYFDDFCKGLKNYDFDRQIYVLDGMQCKNERDYSGSKTDNSWIENKELVAKMKSEFYNAVKRDAPME